MSPALLASLSVALGVLCSIGRRSHRLTPRSPSMPARRVVMWSGATVLAVSVVIAVGRPAVFVLAAGLIGIAVRRRRRRARERAAAAIRRGRVIEACEVLASDLRAGRVPADALVGAAAVCPELTSAVAAARLGDDVPATLTNVSTAPGAGGLRALSAGWQLAEQSGAALAAVTERIADALRGEEQIRRQVAAGLAGTRATGRLLAGLPVLGLALGYGVGAHPIGFLTGTVIGWICLALGILLAGAGLAWIERLADSCEEGLR